MLSEIKIRNRSGRVFIDIEGVIGVPEQMQFDRPEERVATYEKFTRALGRISAIDAGEVVVNIRSTGGDVNDALLIYEALTSLPAVVVTRCYGYVASAATIIAQAASEGCREISANTLYLVHCSESAAEGNSRSFSMARDMLEATDARIAEIYAARSGRGAGEFAALMNENGGNGRWLTAEEAVAAGLADRVIAPGRPGTANGDAVNNCAEVSCILRMLGLPDIPAESAEDGTAVYDAAVRDGDAEGAPETHSGRKRPPRHMLGKLAAFRRAFIEFFRFPVEEYDRCGDDAGEASPMPGALQSPRNAAPDRGQDSESVTAARRDAQDGAERTMTRPKEDPSLTEYRRTANEAAYDNDLQNIRIR